jgi:23S rRNA (cytosine1962-C5)-methyltransferase
VSVPTSLKGRLAQGHPWVYRNQVNGGERLRSGTWVRLRCGNLSAVGLWDTHSPIALRVFSRTTVPDADWISARVTDAWELRATIRADETNAYRWLYGEGDGLPGLVVDRYGDYAIIQTYAASVATLVPLVVPALRRCDPNLRGIVQKTPEPENETRPIAPEEEVAAGPRSQPPAAQLQQLWGELPPADLVIQEHGLFFRANLYVGQKTGLFLDQRANRHTVEQWAMGRRVLNCFAYTGGFSLYALRGGATEVVSCDSAHAAAVDAANNMHLNGFTSEDYPFLVDDCFKLLDRFWQQGRRFEMVILDPPSFARAKSSRYAAGRAYTRLNALALRCVTPGGVLVSSSCTSQVSPEMFREALAEAAQQSRQRLQILHEAGQPADHPVPAGFPEGRYLKFVIARVLPLI